MLPFAIQDAALVEVALRALREEPLAATDFARLLATFDVHAVRALADQTRRRAHGEATTAVRAVPPRFATRCAPARRSITTTAWPCFIIPICPSWARSPTRCANACTAIAPITI